MKLIIELIILGFVIRWISQFFKVQQVHIHQYQTPPPTANKNGSTISGSVNTKTSDGSIGNYVDYEEVKD